MDMAARQFSFSLVVRYFIAILFALLVLIPLVMTVFGGLKSTPDLMAHPIGRPDRLHWENFDGILQSASFWIQLRNSLFVMLVSAIGVVLLASMPAFIFARILFPGRE